MTIEEAAEIFNKYNHYDSTDWEVNRFAPESKPYLYSNLYRQCRSEFEAIAIAKEYLDKDSKPSLNGEDFLTAIENVISANKVYYNLPKGGNKMQVERIVKERAKAREHLATLFDQLIKDN